MVDVNSLVEKVLKKHVVTSIDGLADSIKEGIENRLFLDINLGLPFNDAKRFFMRKYFEELMIISYGNVSKAAKISGLNRRHLHRLAKTLNLKPQQYRIAMQKPYNYLREDIMHVLDKKTDYQKSNPKIYTKIADDFTKTLSSESKSFIQALKEFEKQYFTSLIKRTKTLSEASRLSKLSQKTLKRRIDMFSIAK